jgi:hypothetical protein
MYDAYIIFETVRNQKMQKPVAILTDLPFSQYYCHTCDVIDGCEHSVHVQLWRSNPLDHDDIEVASVRDEDHAEEMFKALQDAYDLAVRRTHVAERIKKKDAKPESPKSSTYYIEL